MIDLALLEPPEGYERVLWADASPGDEVYLACLPAEPLAPAALSAKYLVVEKFILAAADHWGAYVHEYGERLLRRKK